MTNTEFVAIIAIMLPAPNGSSTHIAASPSKNWLVSASIGGQISLVIASGCVVGLVAILKGESLRVDAASALSGLVVAAISLDIVRAVSKRDPEYGLPLVWKAVFVVLGFMAAMIVVMVFLVLQKTNSVDELWSLLSKAGMTELLASTMLRLTDPKG